MTPEQIEAQLKQTADAVESGLEDIKKNKASKQEVLDLISEKTKEDKELIAESQIDIETLNNGMAEARALNEDLQKKFRQLKQSSLSEISLAGHRGYRGNFSSPQEAKTFALLVMAAVTSDSSKLQTHHDRVMKSLNELGIEPYWVDTNGHHDKAMVGSSQTGGGALVTVEQVPTILKLLERYGVYRANALPMPMGAGAALVPKIDGLLTVTCPGEGGTATETEPDIQVISMTPKTLVALTAYSLELEEDSLVALGELLADLFARSFAYYEDLCGFLGDGTSTYFGFKGITGALLAVDATIANIKSLVVGAGNAYSELTIANFNSVIGTLPQFADGNAKWYEHRYFYYTVFVALALAAGGVSASEVIIGAGQKQKLQMGYPVEFTQVMPRAEANSQICSIFGDLRQGAYLGVRGGLEFASSSERYFEKGLIAVRGRDRVSINAHGVGDTTKAGPICALITAAS